MSRRTSVSIDLSRSKPRDDRGNESEEEENEMDMFNAARFDTKTTWSEGGKAKDKVLNTIISRFSMLIHKEEGNDQYFDERSSTDFYSKLPTVLKSLSKLILQLQDHDNRDTREFTIFIATKNWMKTILRPLLEISAEDDITTISHCRRLLFFLLRDMTDSTKQALNYDPLKKIKGDDVIDKAQLNKRKENATKQLSALIGFKEALCSEGATLAFVKLFNRFWAKEIEIRNNLVGVDKNFAQRPSWEHVGKILFTIGRLLEIDLHPLVSRPDEIASCRRSQMQLIVYFRSVLFALPGILLQLGEDHKDRYFDQWLSYLFKILHHCLREFRVKDLHKVLVCNGILGSLHQGGEAETILFDPSVTEGDVPVPEAIQKLHAASTKGLLGEKLRKGKANRLTNSGMTSRVEGGRHSRFGGVFYTKQDIGTDTKLSDLLVKPDKPKKSQRASTGKDGDEIGDGVKDGDKTNDGAMDGAAENAPPEEEEEVEEAPKGAIRPQGIVRRGVQLSLPSQDGLPQAAEKKMKRNSTYALDATAIDAVDTSRTLSTSGQEACVVVASVIDLVCASKGLNEMIKRVGHDFYREDGIFLDEMKLTYFEILSKCLAYNRLKLTHEKKHFDAMRKQKLRLGESAPAWEPDLRNMSSAMDKLTETHVLASMEDSTNRKKFHEVVKAMELYKEIICYIRLQLESANRFHRDFAVAYLYRLFYATTERTDPLPKLLSEWKPGRYSRRHLNCLVEVVHETMKTLDMARSIFGDEKEIEKARKSKGRGSAGIELYTSAAYRFDPNEYFKRLVNNQSVRIYTRVLEKYAANEESINHYVYVFFRRVSNYILEQRLPVPHPKDLKTDEERLLARVKDPAPNTDGPLSLKFLLYNVTTLSVFSNILSDRHIEKQPVWAPMLSLIKDITRGFFEAAEKNHLLFVEALFQHPHPINFWETVDNVYEAQDYKPGMNSRIAGASHRQDSDAEEEEVARPRESDAGFVVPDDDDGDGEFNENDENVQAVTKDDIKRQKAEKRRLKAVEKAARAGKKLKRREKKSSSSSKGKSTPWSDAEDEKLKDLFDTFKDTSNRFSHIANDSEMQDFGTERSDKEVEQRCRALGLHTGTSLSDDEDLFGDGDDQDATQTQTQTQTQTDTAATLSQPQATQEQMLVDSDDDGDTEQEESPVFVRRSALTKRKPSEREQDERVASEPSSPVEKSEWESAQVDVSRFDAANEAAEEADSSTVGTNKRRKKTSLKKKVSSQNDDDDDDNLEFD